jgi:hypothetical protein
LLSGLIPPTSPHQDNHHENSVDFDLSNTYEHFKDPDFNPIEQKKEISTQEFENARNVDGVCHDGPCGTQQSKRDNSTRGDSWL